MVEGCEDAAEGAVADRMPELPLEVLWFFDVAVDEFENAFRVNEFELLFVVVAVLVVVEPVFENFRSQLVDFGFLGFERLLERTGVVIRNPRLVLG